jgi:hypothetical protein
MQSPDFHNFFFDFRDLLTTPKVLKKNQSKRASFDELRRHNSQVTPPLDELLSSSMVLGWSFVTKLSV